ncbi:MAG: phospho-N-acetylmuramoyl-pentapeptide-transferase [Eubacterium sp.]|nr:phospho-N-acetylmuramoyl-pentapeptide-transferase [Eubacterium sp.]
MTWTSFLPLYIAFVVTMIAEKILIPILKKRKAANTERVEGVQAHLKKAGTPTMGGAGILLGIICGSVFFIGKDPEILPVFFLTIGFGLIGFIDDFLKVILRRSDGLIAWQKLLLELAVTIVFLILLTRISGTNLLMRIPLSGGQAADMGIFAYVLAVVAILATVNGVNFTDGLDGLCSSVTIVVALFFTVSSSVLDGGITPVTTAVAGALMAFLFFNAYPAKIFMGDTGSLALGGFVAAAAYMMHMPLYILLVGFIYAIELLSVAMQVTYFKATHGKRIFKMTPIHHHFELSGFSETQIVAAFTVITALLSILCLFDIIR